MVIKTRIPKKLDLGQYSSFSLSHAILRFKEYGHQDGTIMGFKLPYFQRGLVWSREQQIRLIQSIFLGIPIGSYSYNQWFYDEKLDGLLIDGQQRMFTIQEYLTDKFKVYDLLYSELSVVEKRRFSTNGFGCFVTETNNTDYLENYYNLMNYGGVSHTQPLKTLKG